MTQRSWADCPYGIPASAEDMTEDQEDWALGEMAMKAIEERARSGSPVRPWDGMAGTTVQDAVDLWRRGDPSGPAGVASSGRL
ncbi:MAG: hypothetical protein HHJ11_07195 [Phycicoccus sp.]|nr:hypothetical protein [Phycicoccus sp.]